MFSDHWSLSLPRDVHGDELAADQLLREGRADGVPRPAPTFPARIAAAIEEASANEGFFETRSIVTCLQNVDCPT